MKMSLIKLIYKHKHLTFITNVKADRTVKEIDWTRRRKHLKSLLKMSN